MLDISIVRTTARVSLQPYYQMLYLLRAVAVETAVAIVNHADTNPPQRDKKHRFADGLYLANDGRKLVVWLYGPGNKYRIGPSYPTKEVEPLKVFLTKVTIAFRLSQQNQQRVEFLPEGFDIERVANCLKHCEAVCELVIGVGGELATRLASDNYLVPFGLLRGHQPEEIYPILYLKDGFAGFCPVEPKLVRLCGERATKDPEHFEFFLRLLLIGD